MLKRDLFIQAMKAGNYKKIGWIIGGFSITREAPEEYKKNPYAYRLVSNPLGMSYCDPDKPGELIKIEDAVAGQALFEFKENLTLQGPDDIPNVTQVTETTYGNLLFNWIVMVHAFGNKLPYQTGKINVKKIEQQIIPRLKDNPKKGDAVATPEGAMADIYISEYLRYTEGMFFLTGLTQLCTWGATKKVLLPPPGLKEYKKKLLDENAGKLNDMATVAKIDAQLIAFDAAYLKGDDGENFLIDGKSRNTVRRKLFLMTGAEAGLDENTVSATLIENSLNEGWDITKFPDMNNSLRAGSFNRGSQTQLGGVSVKWLLRASSNMNITEDDCGSRIGGVTLVDDKNKAKMVGFSIITKEGSRRIKDLDDAGTYLGKKVMMRNPMYCKLTKTDYCKVCVGDRLMVNTDGLSIAVADYGNKFLSMYLAGAHAKALVLAKMDLKTAIF